MSGRQKLAWRIMALERRLSGAVVPDTRKKDRKADKNGRPSPPQPPPPRPPAASVRLPEVPEIEDIEIPHLVEKGLFAAATPVPGPDDLDGSSKADKLNALRSWLGNCSRCRLSQGRTNVVFGEGNPEATLVFVGEGPGADEDATGRPFVGRAGQLLNKMIEAMGIKRDDVYICNVVKCRPPENRAPSADETAACGPVMYRQLEIISPQLIVSLGSPALLALTERKEGISKMRGRLFRYGKSLLLPTYHPAYLLRNPAEKKTVWLDLKIACALLGLKPLSRSEPA